MSPTIGLVTGFAAAILVGTAVLMLPIMTAQRHISLIDALFTATSAVCVTGLTVVDTGTYFTLPGQWSILLMIQVGGLGIFTFSSFFVFLLRGDTSLRGRLLIQETMTHFPYHNLLQLLRNILFFTFATEAAGALLLWLVFRSQYSGTHSSFLAVFHSIAAFCNAGFSLWANNLEDYSANAPVCFIIMVLVIVGGLGFIVVTEIGEHLLRSRKEFRRTSIHTRLVLITTIALIVGGAVLFWLFELGDASFTSRPLPEQLLVSAFQSVTARTAGFNTVRMGNITNASLFLLICLMFIGASPGSVGGGVKTTTFSIVVIMVVSYLRGREQPEFNGRTIPGRITSKAIATIVISFALVVVSMTLVQVFESAHGYTHFFFIDFLFEAVSAFGTVGLSTGVTPNLSCASKLVIVITMFCGRIGPLGLALSLLGRETEQRYKYPEENVMIG
jgi:trk system potassium uptake protein TrkH